MGSDHETVSNVMNETTRKNYLDRIDIRLGS